MAGQGTQDYEDGIVYPVYHLTKRAIYCILGNPKQTGYAMLMEDWNPSMQTRSFGPEWIVAYGPGAEVVGLRNFIESLGFESCEEEAKYFQDLIERWVHGDDDDRELIHAGFQAYYYENRGL